MEYKDLLDYKFDNFNYHLIKMFIPSMKIMMQSTCRLIFVKFCWIVLKWQRDEPDFADLPRIPPWLVTYYTHTHTHTHTYRLMVIA